MKNQIQITKVQETFTVNIILLTQKRSEFQGESCRQKVYFGDSPIYNCKGGPKISQADYGMMIEL